MVGKLLSTLLYGGQVVIYSTLWWASCYLLYLMVGKLLFTLLYGVQVVIYSRGPYQAPHEPKRRGKARMHGRKREVDAVVVTFGGVRSCGQTEPHMGTHAICMYWLVIILPSL